MPAVTLGDPSCTEPGHMLGQAAALYNPIHQPTNHQVLAVSRQVHLQMSSTTPLEQDSTPDEHLPQHLEAQMSFRSLFPETWQQHMVPHTGALEEWK